MVDGGPLIENANEDDLQIEDFCRKVYEKYGYDFRNYARAAFKRRIMGCLPIRKCETVSQLQELVCAEPESFYGLLNDLTLTVTELFRDAAFYKSLRTEVIPHLKTYPEIRVWHAGCSTGEEVASLAIVLNEEGLYDRATIYATDINPAALKRAREGFVPVAALKEASARYFLAGGTGSLSDYYIAKYKSAMLDASLRKNVVFADHNLSTDEVFGEMHLILCRNVLIYFDRVMQMKVVNLFSDSLVRGGFLCLGARESLPCGGHAQHDDFESFVSRERVFRKRFSSRGLRAHKG